MADNVEKLVDAGCIAPDHKLTGEERAVIESLSKEEVDTLIGIREKLDKERAKSGTSAILSEEEVQPSPSIIV